MEQRCIFKVCSSTFECEVDLLGVVIDNHSCESCWLHPVTMASGASIQNAPYSFMLMVFSLFFFLFVICPYPWYNILDKTLYSVCKELYLYYSTMNCTNQQYLNIKPTLTIMNPLCPASEVSKMLKTWSSFREQYYIEKTVRKRKEKEIHYWICYRLSTKTKSIYPKEKV